MRGSRVMTVVGAVGLVLGLAACGSSSSSSKASTATTATSATTVVGAKAPAGDAAKYCEVAKQVEADTDKFSAGAASEADLEPLVAAIVAGVSKAEKVAPAEIEAQLATVLDGFKQLQAVFEKNGYDVAKVAADPEFAKLSADSRFSDAGVAVDAFNQNTCGIGSSNTSTTTG